MGWVVNATPRPLYPLERSGTHFIGGWASPRFGLDTCGKSRPRRDSIPVASRYTHYTTLATITFDSRTVQPVVSRYTHYTTRPTLPFDPRTVQPVASRYTDYVTRPSRMCITGLFVSPSGISELDCATNKTDTAEGSISIGRESVQVFFLY